MLLASFENRLIIKQFKSSFLGNIATCMLETSHVASDVGNYKVAVEISNFGIRPDLELPSYSFE